MIILGIDGLDPGYVRTGIEQGRLPNFQQLANQGSFSPLGTTWVPLSPVAWSSFISGSNPGKHGIFDFLHRDPETYEPYLSIAQQHGPPRTIEIGPYEFPVGSGYTEQGRKGPAFWTESSRQHVTTTVIRCPVSFPPEPVRGKMLSGLGVPDLNGTQGSFTFLTTNRSVDESSRGGTIHYVDHPRDGLSVSVQGPPNPFLCDHPRTEYEMTLDVEGGRLSISGAEFDCSLNEGEWSDWHTIDFDFLGPFSTQGQVRFYLKSMSPHFELYMSPVNISPEEPAFPISHPEEYSQTLSREVGPFHTLGLTADTGMLKEERVRDVTFLEQTNAVLEERIAMLKHELTNFEDGIFNCVFDIPDRIQHMFWRFEDPDHPAHTSNGDDRYGDVITNLYEQMDQVVGWVLDELSPEDDLIICSDHGFSSFRRQVDLNTWLLKKGYLSLQDGGSPKDAGPVFHGVDWSRTKAYAIGLGGIYINRRDREKNGIVAEDDAEDVARDIADGLQDIVDEPSGEAPVASARLSSEVYEGPHTKASPDVLIGYNTGYRVSWESAIGGFEGNILADNNNKWSGDHGLSPELIPGTFMSNFEIDESDDFSLSDVIPGVFQRLNLQVPSAMDGHSDWLNESSKSRK
jgi:predicted AlkP superfamily phosphohydrolase/phosphomutase